MFRNSIYSIYSIYSYSYMLIFIHSEIYIQVYMYTFRYIFRYIFKNMYIQIYSYIYSEYVYIRIYIISEDAHKTFPPHKMRSGNVDTSYYRYAGYGSSIFTISRILYLYGFSDVIKIFLETGKWDNLSLIDLRINSSVPKCGASPTPSFSFTTKMLVIKSIELYAII